jgi:MYXO-CTERM domain-containing protein
MLCADANSGGSNAPVTITLGDGRQLLTTMYGDRTALDELPAAYDIAETGASGAPVAVGRADGRSPAAELASANAAVAALFPDRTFTLNAGTDPTIAAPAVPSGRPTERNLSNGGCSTGGTAANALGLLFLALAILRRRTLATLRSE